MWAVVNIAILLKSPDSVDLGFLYVQLSVPKEKYWKLCFFALKLPHYKCRARWTWIYLVTKHMTLGNLSLQSA